MDKPLLRDKDEFPTDAVLLRHLGRTKAVWDEFVSTLAADLPSMTLEWRFYNDGASWLCKLVHKHKTVCWVFVRKRMFGTTFYFTATHNAAIGRLPIDARLKRRYRSAKSHGLLKPLTIEVRTKKALADVFEMIRFKTS